ncbi:MAG: hypothetical protein U0230_28010 [Polyangiales bacterium]
MTSDKNTGFRWLASEKRFITEAEHQERVEGGVYLAAFAIMFLLTCHTGYFLAHKLHVHGGIGIAIGFALGCKFWEPLVRAVVNFMMLAIVAALLGVAYMVVSEFMR